MFSVLLWVHDKSCNHQAEGIAQPSIAATLLTKLDDSEDKSRREHVIENITGTAYAGGSPTASIHLRRG